MINLYDIFVDTIEHSSGSGSIRATCHCGKTYFSDHGDYEEGELEELNEKMKKEPIRYECGDWDCVSTIDFNACTFVKGCSCKWEDRYARFLYHEMDIIVDFYKRLKKATVKEAFELSKKVDEADESTRTSDDL
jgi:hypothetical protein